MHDDGEIRFSRNGSGYVLETELWLPRSRDQIFEFFAEAGNLDELTPSWLQFKIDSPGKLEMTQGALIDYRLRIRGVPIKWQSEITVWEPPNRFVDEQRRGPYRGWTHEHVFLERDGGTTVRDRVRYAVPGGEIAHRLFVKPDLRKIFAYRHKRLRELFTEDPAPTRP